MRVYILMGGYDYEGDRIISVHRSREKADAEMMRIQEHKSQKPDSLPDWLTATDAELAEWDAKDAAWRKGLPNGMSDYDSHYIIDQELVP